MSNFAIRARDLTKVYRLYSGPGVRFLDMMGLLRKPEGAYTEHAALEGISLDVARGEKVAFIGRNGAGKSTLLKLITGVIEPTSGSLAVQAKAHALLQIGTGFHPDFTGRDNVYAYLAQLGVTGGEADRKFAEIVEFAELEEYISQPIKTYSSGMAVRLMFSTSTAITPDLLVLDEVLGVGDAYFANKSCNRIRELCERDGTTLLLVTHDVYSAVRICERIIWIDRGRVVMDGEGGTVVKAYEDSIRLQEERRLRLRQQERLKQLQPVEAPAVQHLVVEIQSQNNRPLLSPLYVRSVKVIVGDYEAAIDAATAPFDVADVPHLQRDASAWGEPVDWHGHATRPFLNYGSSFHKVALVFPTPAAVLQQSESLEVVVESWLDEPGQVLVNVFSGDQAVPLGKLQEEPRRWSTVALSAPMSAFRSRAEAVILNTAGIQGTGAITVVHASFVDVAGQSCGFLRYGMPATMEIGYRIADPDLNEYAQVVVAIHRDGVQDVCRVITRSLRFDAKAAGSGTIRITIPRLMLTDGSYTVTIMISKEGYYDREQTVFYSINAQVYCCISRMFEFIVEGAGLIGRGTLQVPEVNWELVRS
jgi:lipopolysaccharide transport system ATP-binding protein